MPSRTNAYLNICIPSQYSQSPENPASWTLSQFTLIAFLLAQLEVRVG